MSEISTKQAKDQKEQSQLASRPSDDSWKKWIGQVVCNHNDDIKAAIDTLQGKQPKDANELQNILNVLFAERLNKVLQAAEDQRNYCQTYFDTRVWSKMHSLFCTSKRTEAGTQYI